MTTVERIKNCILKKRIDGLKKRIRELEAENRKLRKDQSESRQHPVA